MQTHRAESRSGDLRQLRECRFHEYFSITGEDYFHIFSRKWSLHHTCISISGISDGAGTLQNAEQQQKKNKQKKKVDIIGHSNHMTPDGD